jgi:hypothetical protein
MPKPDGTPLGSSELGNRMLGCRGVWAGCEVFRDQPGSPLGVDKPGRVSGWQLVKPAVLYLIDRGPRALDG